MLSHYGIEKRAATEKGLWTEGQDGLSDVQVSFEKSQRSFKFVSNAYHRIRRVKCDEAKPSCRRCSTTGRKCDGYNPDTQHAPPKDAEDAHNGIRIQRLPDVLGSNQEKRGFNYFLSRTAPELSGYYNTTFWKELILKAGSTEPVLRHAVIAIGALHEDFANKSSPSTPNFNGSAASFATNQYTRAIGRLRMDLASGEQAPLTALMSCVLFVCFDSLRGHFESAMVHLKSGLRILKDMRMETVDIKSMIRDSIAPLFLRLCSQANLYIDTMNQADRREFAELMSLVLPEPSIPETFQTIEGAKRNMDRIAGGVFRMFYLHDGEVSLSLQPTETFGLHGKYRRLLADWNASFEKFMQAKSQGLATMELRGAALLKIHHLILKTMLGVGLNALDDPRRLDEIMSSPPLFEIFVEDFKAVVNLSRSLIQASEQDLKNGSPPLTFSTDLGLVGPLFYVCVKSSEPALQDAAMALLKRIPRREGMWDSAAEVRMVEEYWVIDRTHNALQMIAEQEGGVPVSLNEVLELVLSDGMKWNWRWKEPPLEPPPKRMTGRPMIWLRE